MKNIDILKAFGDIKDDHLDTESVSKVKNRSFVKRGFTKWAGIAAAVLVVALVGSSVGNALNKAQKSAREEGYDGSAVESYYQDNNKVVYGNSGAAHLSNSMSQQNDMSTKGELDGNPPDGTSNAVQYGPEQVKLIYKATISGQTTDFAKASAEFKALVESCGGYFESQSVSNGNRYGEGADDYLKIGNYVARIPSEKYRSFMDGVGTDITITSLLETVDDIGLVYAETESKLETLRIKLDRLQNLLSEATDMSDIIELEGAISDTEYSIGEYQNVLNKYNSLVGYSTITLKLDEVLRPGVGIEKKEGFFHRLGREFVDGLENAWEGLADFFYWVSYNFVGIIVFAIVVFLLVKFRPVTKLIRKIRKKA